jgi:site-specific DNA-methyltransferase (adenine-specific)
MASVGKKNATATSSFGSAGRTNHDASRFYAGRLYEGQPCEKKTPYRENPVPSHVLNSIITGSSERMDALPDCSIHLMVTSPPYNVGKDYDENLTLPQYREFLRRVWGEAHRVLVPGGRACINVANLGRKPYVPLHAFVIEDMEKAGFLMRGEIIWNKSASGGGSTAWGSWCSATNPTLRDVHEYILVFSRDTFGRESLGRQSTISRDEFLEFTKSVWSFPTESAKRVGHPAPFPRELPRRLIQLYTFLGECVLDPFMGSGQTALAAMMSNRSFVGYEISEEYAALARERIRNS